MLRRKLSDYNTSPRYEPNFDKFEEYTSKHRQHQKEAIEAAKLSTIGQILSPCGTGKTRIQASLHIEEMIEKETSSNQAVCLIASHRLALNIQLLGELVRQVVMCGLSFNILFVGSYPCNFEKYYEDYTYLGLSKDVCECLSTTSKKEIDSFTEHTKDQSRHLIIVSTYHSFDQLKDVQIDLCTYDEAHTTIGEDFSENISIVKPNIKKNYFFTATRRTKGEDEGMNNKEFYGEVLFDAFPNLMLARGEIVAPKIHYIDSDNGEETRSDNEGMLVKNLIEAFEEHRSYIKSYSLRPDKLSPVLLVSCAGIEEMLSIYNSESFKAYIAEKNIKAMAISSNGGFFNHETCGKQKFLEEMNKITPKEEAIIFNVDMLTEGIDLPSITGVMPLRNMSLTKLIQLIGRCLRLHLLDRSRIYDGSLLPSEKDKFIKPYGWLIIPRHLTMMSEHKQMVDIARAMINEYGSPVEDIVVQEKFIAPKEDKLESMIPFNSTTTKKFELIHGEQSIVGELNYEKFETEFAGEDRCNRWRNLINKISHQ